MNLNDLPAALTVEEAASIYRIARSSAYEGVRTGEIPSIRIGRSIRVPTAQLLERLGLPTVDNNTGRSPPNLNAGAADETTSTAPKETEVSLSLNTILPVAVQTGSGALG